MADRWMDERDRDWRERDRRRSERFGRSYGRGEDDRYGGEDAPRWGEDRSWAGSADEEGGSYEDMRRRDRDYGEDDRDYERRSQVSSGGGAYGAGGTYGAGMGYDRTTGGRGQAYGRGQATQGQRFTPQDYTRGYAGEAGRGDYGYNVARARYGDEPDWRREEGYGARSWDQERASGGRGYDEDRERWRDRANQQQAGEGWREREHQPRAGERGGERRGESGGDFLQRAGERISSWFRGDERGRGEQDQGGPRRYSADFGREPRWEVQDRGHRGRGPKGYKRSDERINEEAHERLTDDPWLDASNIQIQVKDGEVTLSGHVDNREAKHRAERLIEDLSGVDHVQNNLRVNPDAGLTSAGRGYGSSALEAEMRRNAQATDPGDNGASGLSGRTSTGAAAERSTGTATGGQTDPKTGAKR